MKKFSLASLKKRLGSRSFALGENVDRDWLLILHTFIIFSLVAFGGSGYFFWKINKGDFFKTPKNNARTIETVNRAKLEKITTKLTERAQKFEQAKTDYTLVDPSL